MFYRLSFSFKFFIFVKFCVFPVFRYLACRGSNICFSFEKCQETEGLHKLILDACQKDYRKRIDPVTALRVSNAEKTLVNEHSFL